MSKKNILITGASGQLGSEIKEIHKEYAAYLNFFFADSSTLDITDYQAIDNYLAKYKIHYLINCAAYTAVDKAEDEDQQELCYRVNYEGVKNIGNAAKKHQTKLIHISTDYVFDGTNNSPYLETDPTAPNSVYGVSKLKGETALLAACPESIIIRTSWLYSVFGHNFVKTMIKLGNEKDAINVVADQCGTPTNAADLAKVILDIIIYAEKEGEFEAGIYHYSNEGITTWYDFTIAIHRAANITTCKVNPITTAEYPTKAKRPKYSVLDKGKIKKTFKIAIPRWEESLNKCIKKISI